MNGYELSRNFFDFCFENPEKVKPNHIALYFFAIEHCNRLGWKEKFGLPTEMAKAAIGIHSYGTYIKTLNDLAEWGFIILVTKSINQYSSNIVALSKFDKALDKALDKAMIKHASKHETGTHQSTHQSIDSIDKHITSKQRNKETSNGGKPHFSLSIPEGYEASVNEWLAHKREAKKPYKTERTTQAMVDKLVKLSNGKPEVAAYMIKTAIENNWSGFFAPKLEDIPSTEPIPLGYRLAAMRCGAKTEDQIRKIIPKFEGLNPDFVGLWFWHNKVVPDAENIRTLPNWIRDMKVEKNEIRKVYAKHKAEGVRAILEKSIEWTKTKLQ